MQMSTMIRNAASWIDRTLGWFFTNGNKVSYERYDSSVEQDLLKSIHACVGKQTF